MTDSGKTYNAQEGRYTCSAVLVLLHRSWELMHWLGVISLISATLDSVGIRRNTWSGRSIGSNPSLPCLLEEKWGCTSTVFSSDNTPERSTVSFVDVAETLLVDVGDVQLVRSNIAVKAERRVGC